MPIDPDRQVPGVATTANELWFDSLVRHQIFLLRLSGGIRNDVIELLNRTERDVSRAVRRRITSGEGPTARQLKRAELLVQDIAAIRGSTHREVERALNAVFRDFVVEEGKFLKKAVEASVPVQLNTTVPPLGQLHALVTERPFEGRVLREWARSLRATDLKRIEDQIKIGITQGETGPAISRRIIGTRRFQGRDGVTQLTRRNIDAITRTATIFFSNAARQAFLRDNKGIFTDELYVATLDSRTTPICRSLDGRTFPIGEGPMPPLHFNCRSLRVAKIADEVVGTRPFKATSERTLARDFSGGKFTSRAQLPRGQKGRFDQFARAQGRKLIGTVPAKVTYGEWLKRQSASFQDDVLGKTRGQLFRRGNLALDKFVNRQGDEIPLTDLVKKDREAFIAAGLDPDDFT